MTHQLAPLLPSSSNEESRQRAPRTLTLLIIAKLVTGGREGLCRLRNVSPGGLMIETNLALHEGQEVAIELRNQRTLLGAVAWAQGGKGGIRLLEPIAVEDVVGSQGPGSRIRRCRHPRSPRISAELTIEARFEGRAFGATLKDISQGGLKVTLPFKPRVNDEISFLVPGLPLKLGIVRWAGEEVGVSFAEPLPFDVLANWLYDQGCA